MEPEQTHAFCAFDTLFTRSVPYILENLFFSLDYKSFKTCMKVNKTWRELLSTTSYQKRLEELLIEKKINEKKLYDASREGNTAEVRELINNHMVDVNFVGPWATPLYWAVLQGHIDTVKLLLDRGAEVDKADNNGITPLHWAAKIGYKEMLQLLLNGGARVDTADKQGSTALHRAASHFHIHIVKLLLDAGADVDKETKRYGKTTLNLAANKDHKFKHYIIKRLMEGGADPRRKRRKQVQS